MPETTTPSDRQAFIWEKSYPSFASWDADIKPKAVFEMLEATVANYPDHPAFDFLNKKYKWSEIGDLVRRFARGLQDLGLKKGQRVGLFLPNCPYFLIAYYGILRAGGTVVNYNPLYARDEVRHQINDSETDIMITADLKILAETVIDMLHETRLNEVIIADFTEMLPFPKNHLFKILKGSERLKVNYADKRLTRFKDMLSERGEPDGVEIDPETDLAVLQYTGGTTGLPKGAMLSHAAISANAEQVAHWVQPIEDGKHKMVGVLPFFHVFAMTAVMNTSVRKAMEIIALPRFDLDQTLDLIHKKKATVFPAVPAIYTAINNHKNREKYDLSSIDYCISGGAPLPVEVKKAFEDGTGCVLVEGYGLTETAPVACVNPLVGDNCAGSIGLPIPRTDISLRDPDTGKEVAQGEKGELCIKGPQVMLGYWNRKEENDGVFTKDGYLRTGDVAIMDEDGYLFIVDRIKDLIITNGYNVYPRHVEEAIYQHSAVEECIVGGLPDDKRGEIVKAWIKLKESCTLTEDELRDFLSDKLSKIQQPKRYEFRDEPLPKTMIGKLSRKDVIAQEKV